jgi:tetratricopeptide (TPR) repeat protein
MGKRTKKRARKKNLPARKTVAQKTGSTTGNYSTFQFLSYEITDEPLEDSSIPKEVQDEIENIFEKTQKSPNAIIGRLEELIKKYPKVPQLYNFISVAYSNLNDKGKSKYYAEKNYQNNPDYLFAKLNYAEICMIEGNYDKVPEILDNKFDIKAMYPERDVFHITEVVGFMGIAGLYFACIGKEEQAELFYKGLKKLAPSHPYTKRLKQQMLLKSVKEGFNRLIGRK